MNQFYYSEWKAYERMLEAGCQSQEAHDRMRANREFQFLEKKYAGMATKSLVMDHVETLDTKIYLLECRLREALRVKTFMELQKEAFETAAWNFKLVLKRIFIYWITAKQCWRSLWKLNLGDKVVYQGKVHILTQGVNDPYWNLGVFGSWEWVENVHRSQFKKVWSISNLMGSWKSTWRFYRTNWHLIWLHNPIDEIIKSPIRGFRP